MQIQKGKDMKKPMESGQFKLDSRKAADIRNKIVRLAGAYTPEWHFDESDPDIGSVLAILFAEQAEWNLGKFNRQIEQLRMDFVNMMGVSLMPVYPAQAYVLFHPVPDSSGGTFLQKGTRLSAPGEERDIVFETVSDCYVTDSRLTHCYQAEGGSGVVTPIFGTFTRQDYFERDIPSGEETFDSQELFSFPEKGIEKNALILTHDQIFDPENDKIYLKLIGRKNMAKKIIDREYRILYQAEEGMLEAEEVELLSDTLVIGRKYPTGTALAIEAAMPPKEDIVLEEILVSSSGEAHAAAFAGNGIADSAVDRFLPFGSTLQLFDEFYIGDDSYFSKGNSVIRIHFFAQFPVHTVGLMPEEKEEDLKIIKRKPPVQIKSQPAETSAQEITLEYFNGTGWKRLGCERDHTRLFASGKPGEYEIRFLCPADWAPSQIGSYSGRCIRMRLMKADNCYLIPCIHTFPVVEHFEISYSYEGKYERPASLERLSGTGRKELTEDFRKRKPVTAFCVSRYTQNALYLGFEEKFEYGPVNLYFEFAHDSGFTGTGLIFEYSSRHGFCRMRVLDGTEGFWHTGIISFLPPEDFGKTEEEGVLRYWIKITQEKDVSHNPAPFPAILKRVNPNGVQVQNVEVLNEEDFYVEQIRPNMAYLLSDRNILDADIWVNERESYTQAQMEEMLVRIPDRVRAEYDLWGNIRDFYVKWEEVEDFENSKAQDGHYILDRVRNEVRFGDGVHVKIPKVTDSTAFTARVRVSDGVKGNVPAGAITDFMSGVHFYGECFNPLPAFGGTDQESVGAALVRGASLPSSRRRLLTKTDYVREMKACSENIDKVSCVVGRTPKGQKTPDHICLVVLMKDFQEGSRSFIREADSMKAYLYSRCEMTIEADKLSIVEPIPVEVSVELWVKTRKAKESFELQGKISEILEKYLNPVADEFHEGWEIGTLPKPSQILMRLHAAAGNMVIVNSMITGRYRDSRGICEKEIDKIPGSPFLVCKNGCHKVHIL